MSETQEKLAELTSAVNTLTEETIKVQDRATTVIDTAESASDRAENSASSAKNLRDSTQQLRNETVSLRDQAKVSADRAEQISELDTVTDALKLAAVPAPDFHLPLISDLQIREGFGPADQIDVSAGQDGSVMVDLPTRSATFDRGSSATHTNKRNALKHSDPNEPRFGRNGLLFEGKSTNILTLNNSSTKLPPTRNVRTDLSVSPSGGVLATVSTDTPDSKWFSVVAAGSHGEENTPLSASFRFRETNGLVDVYTVSIVAYRGDDVSVGDYPITQINAPVGGFQPDVRYTLSGITDLGENWNKAELRVVFKSTTAKGSQVCVHWFQMETNPTVSSEIPTSDTPSTRLKDALETSVENTFAPPYSLSFVMRATGFKGNYPRLFIYDDFRFESRKMNDLSSAIFVLTNNKQIRADDINLYESNRITLVRTLNEYKLYINGALASTTDNTSRGISEPLRFNYDDSNSLFAWVQDFRIWAHELAPEQVSALGSA